MKALLALVIISLAVVYMIQPKPTAIDFNQDMEHATFVLGAR